MYRAFVLVESSPNWFQLIHRKTFQTISCGSDLNMIFGTLRKYVIKYGTEFRLERAMQKLLADLPLGPASVENAKKLIAQSAERFSEQVAGVVDEAMNDRRKEGVDKTKKAFKRKILVSSPPALEEKSILENTELLLDIPDFSSALPALAVSVKKPRGIKVIGIK